MENTIVTESQLPELPNTTEQIVDSNEDVVRHDKQETNNDSFASDNLLLQEDVNNSRNKYVATRAQRDTVNQAAHQTIQASETIEKNNKQAALQNEVVPNANWTPFVYNPNLSAEENAQIELYKGIQKVELEARSDFLKLYGNNPTYKFLTSNMKFEEKAGQVKDLYDVKVNNQINGTTDGLMTIDKPGPLTVSVNGHNFQLGSLGMIVQNGNTEEQKKEDIKAIAERLHIAPYQVTDKHLEAFYDWQKTEFIKMAQTGTQDNFEMFDYDKADQYKQFIAENGKDIAVKFREIPDLENLNIRRMQILSKDGRVNLSDTYFLNPYLNLQWNIKTKEMYYYADAYIQGLLPTPTPLFTAEASWVDVAKIAGNSIFDTLAHWFDNVKALKFRYVDGDENKVAEILRERELNPSEKFFQIPPEVELHRQIRMQQIIDQGNEGGFWNSVSTWLKAFVDAPAVATAESMGEMGQIAAAGAISSTLARTLKMNRLGKLATTFVGLMLGAGLEETINAEADYYVKHGKAMPNNLFLGAWALNSAVLGLELPALARLGAGTRRLVGLPGTISTKGIKGAFGGLGKDFSGFLYAIANEGVTEPLQNATFQAWLELNGLSEIGLYPRAWLRQWEGTNWGQRLYESGSAAGSAALLGGFGTVQSIAGTVKQGIQTEIKEKRDATHSGDKQLNEDEIKVSNNDTDKNINDISTGQAEIEKAAQDPNTDVDTFINSINSFIAKLDLFSILRERNETSQGTPYSDADKQKMQDTINNGKKSVIGYAIKYAKTHGIDMKQMCDVLYNQLIAGNPHDAPIDPNVDTVQEIFKMYEKAVLFSFSGKRDDDTSTYIDIDLSDDPDTPSVVTVKEDDYNALKSFYEEMQKLGHIPQDMTFEERVFQDFKLESFGIDLFSSGYMGNSVMQYRKRINEYILYLTTAKNGIIAALNAINQILPENEKLTLKQLLNMGEDDFAILKDAYPEIAKELTALETLRVEYIDSGVKLMSQIRMLYRFIIARETKFEGFINAIKAKFGNGNTQGKVIYQYDIKQDSSDPITITLTFNGSTLLYSDLNSDEVVRDEQGRISHPDQVLLRKMYKENLLLEEQVSALLKDIHDVIDPEMVEKWNDMVDDPRDQHDMDFGWNAEAGKNLIEGLWSDLLQLQENVRSGRSKSSRNKQILSGFNTAVAPIISACIAKLLKEGNLTGIAAQMAMALTDGSWLEKAQVRRLKDLLSPARTQSFLFQQLYAMMTPELRASFKQALEDALNQLIAMTEVRFTNDPSLASYSEELRDEFMELGPYKDRTANLLYNLKLQIEAVEASEAAKQTEATNEVNEEDVQEVKNTPEMRFQEMYNSLIQQGRFYEAERLNDNKEEALKQLADNENVEIESLVRQYVPKGLRVKIDGNMQSQDIVLTEYEVQETGFPKVLQKIIDFVANGENVTDEDRKLVYWAKRAILNKNDENVFHRAGYAMAILFKNLSDPNFAKDSTVKKLLQKYFKREIDSYEKTKVVRKYITDENGKKKLVTFDYSLSRERTATWDFANQEFRLNQETVYFYGQKVNKDYSDTTAEAVLTPTVTFNGQTYYPSHKIFMAQSKDSTEQQIEKTIRVNEIDRANSILDALCKKISKDGVVSYSAGFLQEATNAKEYAGKTIQKKLTEFQDYLAVLIKYVQDGGNDSEVLAVLESIKAGYMEIDGLKIPVPSVDIDTIPQRDSVLTAEQVMELRKTYFIRQYTGTTENPLLNTIIPGQKYKVYAVTGVPVNDLVSKSDETTTDGILAGDFSVKPGTPTVKGEIIIVPADSNGTGILTNYKPAQDSEIRSRTRNSSQANALNGPSVFLLQGSKQERNKKLFKKDILFLNKKIMAGVSGTGIRAIFSILTNIGNVCRNKDGSDCITLANIIRTVNDYSAVSPELGMVLQFLHELNNRIEAIGITYSMYFVGHNRNVKGWELEAILRQIDNPIEYLQSTILGNNDEVSRSVYQNVFNIDLTTLYTKAIFDQDGNKRRGYRGDNSWFITNRLLRDFFTFYYPTGNTLSNSDFQKEYAHMEINPNDVFVETDDVETLDIDGKGKKFEEIAEQLTKTKGWEIVERNKTEGNGEIDIIAKDENGKLHLIEVRYRGLEETAKSSINDKKASAMIKAAEAYAKRENLTSNDYSIDLLSIDKKGDNTVECTLQENYLLTNEQQQVQYSANFDEISDEEYEQRLADEDISRDPEINLGTMKLVPFSESGKNKFKSGVYVLAVNNTVSAEQQTLLNKITSYMSEQDLIARTNDFFYESNANDNIPAENRETITADELAANNNNDNSIAEVMISENFKNTGKPESNVRAGKLLMGRNLKVPVDFVIYDQEQDTWVKGALREVNRMAKKLNIPMFNIRAKNFLKQFKTFIRKYIASKGDKQPLISKDPNLLEVSTKDKLGKVFSAMNMYIVIGGKRFCIESVYQASKLNDEKERDKVAHMNGFQAKQYNKDEFETDTYGFTSTGMFAGKEINLSALYFGLYATSLAQMMSNEYFKQLLINAFKNYDGYKDTFRGFKTVNSQADVMNFLRAKYFLLGEEEFFNQLKEYTNSDNITKETDWAKEFVKKVEHRFGINFKQRDDLFSSVFDNLSLEKDTKQYMRALFNELYRYNGFVDKSHLWLMRPILEMRDNANRKNLGWSTVISALIGELKGTPVSEKLINGGYASTNFIINNGTTTLKDGNNHVHVAKEGFLLSRLQSAFNGTTNFDNYAMLVGTDVLVVVDKKHNIDLIIQNKENVRATDLLAAILLTRFITSDSKEYNMMRRTVNRMIGDPSIDKTIDFTTDQQAAFNLVTKPDLTIDEAITVLGLEAEYTETQNSIKQQDESAKQAKKQAVINNDNISEEENNNLITEEIARHEKGNTSSVIKAYQTIQTSRNRLSQELIDKRQELFDAIQSTSIEEREFYIQKYLNNLRNMLTDSEKAFEGSKQTLKELDKEMRLNDLSDWLVGQGVDINTVPTDKLGIYNGVDSVTIVYKYIANVIKDAAIWNEFLNKIASFRDIPPLPDNIEKETQIIVNKSLPNLMEMTIFDKNLQSIVNKDGNIKSLKELSLEEQQEYIANLIERCPAIQLMYDFNIKDGKIVATVNPVIARALYQVTLQELLDYNNTTKNLSDSVIAKLEGVTEEQLKSSPYYDETCDFYKENGVPFVTYVLTLGRKVVNKLGLSIKRLENDRYSLSDEIAYQLGIAVWNIIEELNTQEIGKIEDVKQQDFMENFLKGDNIKNTSYSDMYNILLYNSRRYLEELKDSEDKEQRKALIAFYKTVNQTQAKDRLRLPKPLYVRNNKNGLYIKVFGYPKAEKHDDKRMLLQELDKNNPIDESVHGLSLSPIKKIDTVNDSDAKITLTDAQKKALQLLQQTPNHIDPIAMDICNKYSNFLFKHEGGRFPGDDARLTAKERLSNKNNSLNRATAILQCLYDEIKDKAFYIKYAVTKTMRFGCKGTVNPQSDKMHRWITYPGEMQTMSINGLTQKSRRDMKYEAWALAQAFDMVGNQKKIQQCYDTLMDICKKDDLDTFEQDLCTLTPKQFESKYGLGIENIYQCISAVAHLRRRVEAMKKGANDFKTSLRAELDSTTSGYFIKIMTLLDAKLIKKFGPKVGIFTDISKIITAIETGKFITDYETMSELKKAINDIYRQVAIEMSKNDRRAIKATWDNIQSLDESYHINELFPNKKAFEEFVDTFPSAQQTIEGDWIVDSDLRELLKGVVMVYGYSAGENTLERKLSEAFYFKYYDAANEVMRDFEDSIGNKENPTLEDFQQYYDNWKNKDRFLLNFFHLTFFYLDIFRRTETSRYKELAPFLLKRLKEVPLEIVTEDIALQEFITYYKFFKMQVNGFIQHGEVIDIYPSMMITSENKIERANITLYHSVESNICDILDNSMGNAMIKGMGEFGSISHSNMVMSTIASILNYVAQQDFNKRKDALFKKKGANWYSDMTNAEYKELLYPEHRITANVPNLFSMMQPSMETDDVLTNRYGLSVVGIKKVQVYNDSPKYFALEIQRAKPANRRANQSQDFLSTRALPEQSFKYSEDLGLELTAGTTQSSDAALLTSTMLALYEQGILGTFIHDAMVLPFNRLDTGNFLYSHFSTLFFSRYNMLLNYIYEGLKALTTIAPDDVKEGLSNNALYEYSKPYGTDLMSGNGILTTLSKINLHNVFGYPKDSVYSKSTYKYDNGDQGHIYSVEKLVRIFKVLAEMSRINFQKFYVDEANATINNMDGYQDNSKSYTIEESEKDILGKYEESGAIESNVYYQDFNKDIPTYEKLIEEVVTREHNKTEQNKELQRQEEIPTQNEVETTPQEEAIEQQPTPIRQEQGKLFSFGLPSFQSESGWTEVLSRANTLDSKAIMAVLDKLPKSIKDDPVAIATFKNFLSQLDLSQLVGWSIQVGTTKDITQGATDHTTKTIWILVNDKDTSVMNPSPATVYMHEVMHAILNYAFTERKNNPAINALVEKMRAIQEEASKMISWKDFLDDPAHATKEQIKMAMGLWNYCFANKNPNDPDAGLKEFLSYASSDPTFIRILKSRKIGKTKVSFWQRIINCLKVLFDIITLRKNVTDTAKENGWFTNNNLDDYAGKDMYEAMQQLALDIQYANADAEHHFNIATKAIYGFYGLVNTLRTCGNKYLTRFTRNLFTVFKPKYINMNSTLGVAKSLAMLPFSAQARRQWYDLVSGTTRILHQTDVRLLLDDFGSIDKQRAKFDELSRNSRVVEAYYQNVRSVTMEGLVKAFGRELTQEESNAVTDIVMCTDLQCLFDGNNIDDIMKVLTDKVYRDRLIASTKSSDLALNNISLSDKTKARINKAIDTITTRWAYVLYYGKGDNLIGTTDNATSVVSHMRSTVRGLVQQEFPQVSVDVQSKMTEEILGAMKERIDKLTTLKALDITQKKDASKFDLIRGLDKHGIEVFLQEHKTYVDKVKDQNSFNEQVKERGKGFSMSRYNHNMECVIAPVSEKSKMEFNGYTMIDNVHDGKNIYTEQGSHMVGEKMGIFIKQRRFIDSRSNSALTFIATKWAGKDLESYFEEAVSLDDALKQQIVHEVENNKLVLEDQKEAIINAKSRNEKSQQRETLLDAYIKREMRMAFDINNQVTEQQIENEILGTGFDGRSYQPMTRQEQVEKLKLSRNCFDIMSRMVATQVAYNEGERQNIAILQLLDKFARNNMNPLTHRDYITGKKYINVAKRLRTELHLGKIMQKGKLEDEVWVREDMVEKLFGQTSTNISQKKHTLGSKKGYSIYRPAVRGAFEIFELILKMLAYKDKETIVMRKPAVIIGNIVSNISYNTLSEPNLKKVIDMNKANIANTNNYLEAHREYISLELEKRRLGDKFSHEKEARMIRLKNQMDNNPIAPLFESGMFTSIIEDVPLKDKEAITSYLDMLSKSKLVRKTPGLLKVILKHMYMTEGTPIFDAFYNMNKYSDFVARATEYQIQMEKHAEEIRKDPSKYKAIQEEVLIDVWNAFIDYDRPNGKVEQYLNDIGVLMFTKYAKGIQRVICKQMIDNPMGAILFLGRELAVPIDISNIFEGNAVSRKWGMLVHNPVSNLVDVLTPPLFRVFGVL